MCGVRCQELQRNGGDFDESRSAKTERQPKVETTEGGPTTGRRGITSTTGRYCTQIV